MEPRKELVPIQDTDLTPEQPVIANDAPSLAATPMDDTPRAQRPAARRSSKGGKGGGKASGGKGSSSGKRVSFGGGGRTVARKPKKKRVKKAVFKIGHNPLLGGRTFRSKKKTSKRTTSKRGLRKRI